MIKRIIPFILVIAVVLSLTIGASAATIVPFNADHCPKCGTGYLLATGSETWSAWYNTTTTTTCKKDSTKKDIVQGRDVSYTRACTSSSCTYTEKVTVKAAETRISCTH